MKNRRRIVPALLLVLAPLLASWQPQHHKLTVLHAGGKGPPSMMLLHGYGSSAEHWLPYARTITLSPQGRFSFPQAPELLIRSDGWVRGRAWWLLDLAAHMRPDKKGVDLSDEDPRGLVRAAALVRQTLSDDGNRKDRPFVLGGFSQGAMVACEVAFGSNEPLAALVVLSGTPMDRAGWRARMSMRKGLPVFMSHGRKDDILLFDRAVSLRDDMLAAGIQVTFVSFDGGHEIPAEVVAALGKFLATLHR
jgi:phospholipase/carboxylesterase